MPSERCATAIAQILQSIERARDLAAGARESFGLDWRTVYAATRCLEIISEASRRLDEDLKSRHPGIPWRDIADAGNVYRHAYEVVEPGRLWDTIVHALPALEAALRQDVGGSG